MEPSGISRVVTGRDTVVALAEQTTRPIESDGKSVQLRLRRGSRVGWQRVCGSDVGMQVDDALRWEVDTSRSHITNFRRVGLEDVLHAQVPGFRIRIFRVRRNVRRSQ